MARNAAQRVTQLNKIQRRHSEIIGRTSTPNLQTYSRLLRGTGYTWDTTRPDYMFWDNLRRGKKSGYELSSLFVNGIIQTLSSWVMGTEITPTVTSERDTDYTNEQLAVFGKKQHGTLGALLQDLYALGNQYVIVNLDGTLSIPSPDTVDVQRDPLDYRRLLQVTVISTFSNATVKDIYTDFNRTVSIKNSTSDPLVTRFGIVPASSEAVFEFDNPLGVMPVVHLPNMASANETDGHPIYEALLRLFSRYDDLLETALDGAEVLSNPIPVFNNATDINDVFEYNTVETGETDDNGRAKRVLDLAAQKAFFTTGDVKFLAPGEFTQDIRNMLKVLFLLMLEHTRIPEAVWGGELGSSRASAGEQMKTFYMYIQWLRTLLEGSPEQGRGGLLQLVQLWLQVKALTDPQIVTDGQVMIAWTALENEAADLRQKKIESAHDRTLIRDETALSLMGLVEDAAAEVQLAHEEAEMRRIASQDAFDAAMDADNSDDQDNSDNSDNGN